MWHYAFISLCFTLCVWLFIVLGFKNNSFMPNTSIELNIIDKSEVFINSVNKTDLNVEKSGKQNKRKFHVPKIMLDLYEERKKTDYSGNFIKPDIVRSVIPKSSGSFADTKDSLKFEENHMLIFDLPSANNDEEFLAAELRILTIVQISSKAILGLERSVKLSVYNETSKELLLLDKRHIYHMDNTWITFNMTTTVNGLLTNPFKNHCLKIIISVRALFPHKSNNLKLSLMPVTEDFEHDYPILLLSYASVNKIGDGSRNAGNGASVKRLKRSLEDDYEEETNNLWDNEQQNRVQTKKLKRLKNSCKKRPLYVDFAEIQYDSWIVQPSGYEAYQCMGKCFYPVADHLSPTKHAIVQALMHSVSPSRAARSCCVPTELDSISLLYIDARGVLTYRFGYSDMVVAECGCR